MRALLLPASCLPVPQTRTVDGAVFAESHMARVLGEDTVLVDVGLGPAAIADGLTEAAATLGVDLLVFVDVGGDVLGNGTEPDLASPLCDAVDAGRRGAACSAAARRCWPRSSDPAATAS